MSNHHFTSCSNPDCGIESRELDVDAPCPYCKGRGAKGHRIRDPKVPSLFVRRNSTDEIISIIPVRRVNQVEDTMKGLLRNMDVARYYIDDSEFD